MLTQIRKIFSGVLGFALIGLLVIAFAAWGVADMFDMVGRGSVAKVGNQKIPTNEYRFRLAQQMDQISRELNEPLTIEQARTFGVDQQVLDRMITLATLNEATDKLGLDVSDDYIRDQIINDPSFAGPGGGFDAPTFRRLLALNGLTEKVFVRDRRNNKTREQMLGAISYATVFPTKLNEIIYTHSLETRKVEYILVQPDMAGVIGDPSEDELRSLYQQVPNIFTEPERRTATILNLSPSNLIDTITVTEEELREEYDILQDDYINAETREVNQLVLTD
ncbi:MAG: SurA N-terminal domain-containing protein, partial [Pseudomonadota bacterium]|nr:SurA N-terminal domain-containing protein [Pseudomonadota bacterium]